MDTSSGASAHEKYYRICVLHGEGCTYARRMHLPRYWYLYSRFRFKLIVCSLSRLAVDLCKTEARAIIKIDGKHFVCMTIRRCPSDDDHGGAIKNSCMRIARRHVFASQERPLHGIWSCYKGKHIMMRQSMRMGLSRRSDRCLSCATGDSRTSLHACCI